MGRRLCFARGGEDAERTGTGAGDDGGKFTVRCGAGFATDVCMPDEITAVREEVAALRAELNQLRLEHLTLLQKVGIMPLHKDEPWPEMLHIDAEAIAVRHSRQHIPLLLRANEEEAYMVFMDSNQRERLKLSFDADGPRLEMRNAEGNLIYQIAEATDTSGQACVCDADGRPRAGMRVTEGGGVVNVLDTEGKALAIMLGGAAGGEVLTATAMQRPGATMKATPNGGLVSVHEPSGQLMGFLASNTESGELAVYGPQGSQAMSVTSGENGGAVVFFDEEGKPKSKLP